MSNETRGVWLIVLTLVGLLVLSTGLGIELKELAGRLSDCEAAVGKLAAQYNRIQALLGPPKLITAEDDDAIEKFLEPILTAPPPAAPEPHDWGPELSIADMRDEIAAEERARDARTEWEKSMSRLATQPDTSVVITTDDVFSPPTDFERGHDAVCPFKEAVEFVLNFGCPPDQPIESVGLRDLHGGILPVAANAYNRRQVACP